MEIIDHVEVMNEFALIIRSQHPAWHGDARVNGYTFLRQVADDFNGAPALASDIEANLMDYAEITGISPRTLGMAVRVLRGTLLSI